MKLLAIDTSTEAMALALCVGEQQWLHLGEGGAKTSAQLLPQVQALLKAAGLALHDLDALAFGAGPGAFTGLRTACSVVQGLAFGVDKPVLPLDSLLIVAEAARQGREAFEVEVAMDARMGEVYAAAYAYAAGQWQVQRAPGLYAAAALGAMWQAKPPGAIAGTALAALAPALTLPPGAQVAQAEGRAAALLRCARMAFAQGQAVPAAQALPVYVRNKVAHTTAERLAAKQQAAS
jgi:tRNA threonylcarbamoyladenosine biosynthesis protein TsaB